MPTLRACAVLAVLAMLGLGFGCGSAPAAPEQPVAAGSAATGPADSCATADDCDLVDTCCGCNNGGQRIAIRKDAVASFTAARGQRCAGIMCPHHVSQDASCDAEAICGSRNRCRVAPHMQHQ